MLTVYDDHGGYGHPDHVQVHRVGVRAAELAGTPRVYESTMNRDFIKRLLIAAGRRCPTSPTRPTPPTMDDFGSPEAMITTTVDVRAYVDHQARRRWPRTRARSPPTRSSCRCPTTRSARRSARSGSSAATQRDTTEYWLFDDL